MEKEFSDKTEDEVTSPNNNMDGSDGEDDEGENHLSQTVLDQALEDISKKINLTALNVRSIIYQVITNKDVQVMFRNQLKKGKLKEQLHEAIFEPKMTRSKLKEVLKSGQVPTSWNITPRPKNKTLFDLDLEEEEEDEEYAPNTEELEHASDDESMDSSRASECASPFIAKSTISSPEIKRLTTEINHNLEGGSITPKSKGTDGGKTTTGPSRSMMPIKKLILQSEETQKSNSVALRTRSKLPLRNTSIAELESMNADPDPQQESPDRSSPTVDNEDWQLFLAGLIDEDLVKTVYAEDEDTNDPEYNFMADEEERQDREEVRFDKTVQIPKKEVKSLLDELIDEFNYEEVEDLPSFPLPNNDEFGNLDEADLDSSARPRETTAGSEAEQNQYPIHIPKLNVGTEMLAILGLWEVGNQVQTAKPADGADDGGMMTLTEEEQIQLKVQMTQHVQLLAQTYVCSSHSQSSPELLHCSNTSKQLLLEIHDFSTKFSSAFTNSFFSTPNLEDAIEITKTSIFEDDGDAAPGTNLLDLNFRQMHAIANSRAFLYPSLLPKYKIIDGDKTKPRFFLKSEDNLLAIGLHHFGHLPNKFKFIKELLLPTKTENQMLVRVRNLKRNRNGAEHESAVRHLFTNEKLPRFERSLNLLGPKDVMPPIKRQASLLPNWFHNYKKVVRPPQLHETNLESETTTKRNSSNLSNASSQSSQDIPQNTPVIFVQVQSMNSGVFLPYEVSPVIISSVPYSTQWSSTITTTSRPKGKCSTSNTPVSAIKDGSRAARRTIKTHVPIAPIVKVFSSPALPVTQIPAMVAIVPSPSCVQNITSPASGIVENPVNSNALEAPPSSISTTATSHAHVNNATCSLQLLPAVSDRLAASQSDPPPIVTFVSSPRQDLPPIENRVTLPQATEDPKVAGDKDLLVTTSTGMTLAVKSLDNSREPCVVLSHEQLKALGIKIKQVSEEAKNIQPVESGFEIIDKSVTPSNNPTTLEKNPSNNEVATDRKWSDLSASNEFLKNFGSSFPNNSQNANPDGNADNVSINGNWRRLQSLNKTLSLHISGDISLNSSDAIGLHNLEDLISSRELSKVMGRTIDSEDSLYKLTDSQLVDLLGFSPFKGMLDNTLPNPESNNCISTSAIPADSYIKNLFGEVSPGDKSKRVSMEYFSSENFASSTPLTKSASSTISQQTSEIVKFAINDSSNTNNNSECLLKCFNDDCIEDKNADPEAPDADVPPTQQIVVDDNDRSEQSRKSCEEAVNVDDNLKVVVFAEDVENVDHRLEGERTHFEQEATDQTDAMLCTPKKFSVNEYDNIKKLSSPALSAGITTPSYRDDMSPNSKRCSFRTIAQLEKLISPPKSPLGIGVHVDGKSQASTPVKDGQKPPEQLGKNSIVVSPFKKRFTKFKPKHLNFCSLDGANDNEAVQKSSTNDRPQLRSVAPKPPFIKITGEPQKSKKPLGRRKQNVPLKKHIVNIRPKDPKPREGAGRPTPQPSGAESSALDRANPGASSFTEDEGGVDEDVLIAELMSASTTIDFNKKATAQLLEKQKAHRQKERQDLMLSLLDEKLLESDPMRKRRDMLYAESYVSRVKERFKDRPDLFSEFNQLLFRFASAFSGTLVEKEAMEEHRKLYGTLKELFKDHEDLLSDYAGFLPLDQAVALGCFISSLEFEKARIFMTKLERYFKKRPQTFHKCLKALKECRDGLTSEEEMKNFITKQIKNNSHLIAEFSWFFPNNRPQLSLKNISFEEVDLCLENKSTSEEFEKVELSMENMENFGTSSCGCACHISFSEQLAKKSRHCPACNLKAQFASRPSTNSVNSQVLKGKCHLQNEDKNAQRNSCSSYGYQKSAADVTNDDIVDGDKSLSSLLGSQPSIPSKTRALKSKSKSPPPRSRFPRPVRKGKSTLGSPSCRSTSENQPNPKDAVALACQEAERQIKNKPSSDDQSRVSSEQNIDKSTGESNKNQKNSKNSRKKNTTCTEVKSHPKRSARLSRTETPGDDDDSNYDSGLNNQRSKRKRCVISSSESDLEVESEKPKRKLRKRNVETIDKKLSDKTKASQADKGIVSNISKQEFHQGCLVQSSTVQNPLTISCNTELWSRDDDKVLLEMCQVSGSDLPTFESVACLLGNKSAEQVKKRFEHLMEIYSKMDSDSETEP